MGERWQQFKQNMGLAVPEPERSGYPLTFAQLAEQMSFGGVGYPLTGGTLLGNEQSMTRTFQGYVQGAYEANGPVFACMVARMMLFAEARFQYRNFRDGRPGDLFGDRTLNVLHRPWQGGTTGDLLSIMETDVSAGGNAFILRQGERLRRLRPDWVTLVFGSPDRRDDFTPWDLDSELLGYLYLEGGPQKGRQPKALFPDQVAHFMPQPDPLSPQRGMAWITPVVREIMGDAAATDHKLQFFRNGATVNMAIEYDPALTKELFDYAVDAFEAGHTGVANAYKVAHLLGGKAKPVGLDFAQMDFKAVQGASETRIASAANVPPIIVGFAEGLASATYSNYAQARRRFADLFARPQWRMAAGSLETIVPPPPSTELWYDDRDIPFLAEDAKDQAEVQQTDANTAKSLIDAGFQPETVVAFLASGDITKLKHTGLFSVQLQPPMPDGPAPAEANGDAAARALAVLLGPHLDNGRTV